MRRLSFFCLSVFLFSALASHSARAAEPEYEVYFRQFKPDTLSGSCDSDIKLEANLTGIFVKWIAGLVVDAMDRAAQARLKLYTASYANKLVYVNFEDSRLWQGDEKAAMSCFAFMRAPKGSVNTSNAAMVMTGRLWRDEMGLRVAAETLSWNKLKAKHAGGDAAISASLVIHSVRNAPEGGKFWTSPEVLLVSEEAAITKGKGSSPVKGPGNIPLLKEGQTQVQWGEGITLPMPPKLNGNNGVSIVAFEIKVAEAGRPSSGPSAWAKFLSDNKDDLSGALSDAIGNVLK